MDSIQPKVSVIVPVYNRGSLLVRCLDTLVYQTLEEIEIVIVDDFSTDNSLEIAETYRERFPNKVFIYKNKQKGVSHAKNVGIDMARGEYITFVDSDDYVEYWAYELMYEKAKENDSRIVFSPMYRVSPTSKELWGRLPQELTVEKIFTIEIFSLCNKIFKREIFDEYGRLPDLRIGEDVSFLYPILTWETNVSALTRAYYYYEISSNSISIQSDDVRIIEDILTGNETILKNSNPEHLDVMKAVVARRTLTMLSRYPCYCDLIITYIKQRCDFFRESEYFEEKYPYDYSRIQRICDSSPSEFIPARIFVNAFGDKPDDKYVARLKKSGFVGGAEVILIDESNCDVNCNDMVSRAYAKKDFDFVAGYFGLLKVYEQGGIYLDRRVHLSSPFNSCRCNSCFFGRKNETDFTSRVFGSIAGNSLLGDILKTYDMPGLYIEDLKPLASRIRTILIVKAGVKLDRKSRVTYPDGLTIYEPEMLFYDAKNGTNVTYYTNECFKEDEVICIPVNVYGYLQKDNLDMNETIRKLRRQLSRSNSLSSSRLKHYYEMLDKRNNVRDERDILAYQLRATRTSASWKITKPLRFFLDMFKRIFRRDKKNEE